VNVRVVGVTPSYYRAVGPVFDLDRIVETTTATANVRGFERYRLNRRRLTRDGFAILRSQGFARAFRLVALANLRPVVKWKA